MMGLCGVGDLVLTCTGNLSRNWQVGNRLAKGESIEEIEKSMQTIAEGLVALFIHILFIEIVHILSISAPVQLNHE